MTRRQSLHEYETRINRVIDYISDHLTESLSLRTLARVACFSEFHFHRIFAIVTGETLNEFVTRLRLERALQLLHTTRKRRLTDVALEAGFNTPSDFSRVFRKRYGVSPSRFDFTAFWKDRKIGKEDCPVSGYFWKEFPAEIRFPVRLKQMKPLRVAYVRVIDSYRDNRVAKGFDRLNEWASSRDLLTREARFIGMSQDNPEITPLEKCRYDVCLTVASNVRGSGGVAIRTIDPGLCAIVRCKGDMALADQVWNYLFKAWLPASGCEPAPLPAMEIFRISPIELGWKQFDLDACVPVRRLE